MNSVFVELPLNFSQVFIRFYMTSWILRYSWMSCGFWIAAERKEWKCKWLLTWEKNPWGDALDDAAQGFTWTQRPVTGGYGLFTDQLQRLQRTNKHKILSEGWTKSVTVLILLLGQFITRHTYQALLKDKLKIKLAVCIFHVSTPNIILILRPSPTQPLRGCHTGSRLHMSLRILKTMTQDLRSVTLA